MKLACTGHAFANINCISGSAFCADSRSGARSARLYARTASFSINVVSVLTFCANSSVCAFKAGGTDGAACGAFIYVQEIAFAAGETSFISCAGLTKRNYLAAKLAFLIAKIVVIIAGKTCCFTIAGLAVINQIAAFCTYILLLKIAREAFKARLGIAMDTAYLVGARLALGLSIDEVLVVSFAFCAGLLGNASQAILVRFTARNTNILI